MVLSLISKVAEEGYPGEVIVTVEYALSGQGELSIDYRSEFTDSPLNNSVTETVVNLTNHSYFNLSGFTKDSVLEHHCTMSGVRGHLELDGTQIPTGKVIENSFASPCMDFTTLSTREEGRGPKTFGAGLPHVTEFRGYDHFYLVNETSEKALEPVVKVYSPESGIYVELSTDAIGFQLYTGNWLDGSLSSCKVDQPGATYGPHSGFCLEASAPPDSLNFKEWRASVILTKGKVQNRRDVYRFGTE